MVRKLLFACVALLAISVLPLSADVVYQQNPTWVPPNGSAGLGWTSVYSTADGGFQTFDNFRVSTNSTVRAVQWFGFYRDDVNFSNLTLPATVTWDLSFLGDNSGVPGASLYDVQEPAASVTAAQLGTTVRGAQTVFVYEFTATLPSAFSVSANTTYWFSPLSLQTSSNPIFVWLNGTGGDGSAYQNQLNPDGSVAGSFVRDQDRAFTLLSTPEPNLAGLLALSLAAVIGCGRLRRRASRTSV